MKTLLTSLGTLGICTAARWYLDRPGRRDREYAGGHIRLTGVWNEGAAFGLPIPAGALLSLTGAVLGTVWTWRRRSPIGVGLALGGGISNLLERIRHKRVWDYVQFPKAPAPLNRYVFNLADLAILAGALMLAAAEKRGKSTAAAPAQAHSRRRPPQVPR